MGIGKVRIWQVGSILRMIYKNPEITRMEISKKLNINKSMITRLINELITEGWIIQTGNETKKIPLVLNKKKIVCAGIEVQPHFQSVVICDLTGNILFREKWEKEMTNFGEFLNGPVLKILESSTINIQAVGLALPGVCNQETGQFVCSSPFKLMSPIDIPPYLKNKKWPVFFENNARCCGWGLVAFKRETDDFIFVLSDFNEYDEPSDEYQSTNIESSIFIDQQAYTGSHFCAGEYRTIIHIGNIRSQQSVIPDSERVKMKSDSKLLEDFIEEFAFHMAYITNYLDVKKIFIGGSLEDFKTTVERHLRTKMLENSTYPQYQKPEIIYPDLNNFSIVKGAAGFAFERLLTNPELENPNSFYRNIVMDINK